MPTSEELDASRAVVMAQSDQVNGHTLEKGEPVRIVDAESEARAELTADQAGLLFGRGALIYADRALPTPVESPEQYAGRTLLVEQTGADEFLMTAPWLNAGVTAGAKDVEARRAEIVNEGAARHRELIGRVGLEAAAAVIAGADGFTVSELGNGYYEVAGPGLDEPLKIRGAQAAEDKMNELRAAAAEETAVTVVAPPSSATAEVAAPVTAQGGAPLADGAAPARPDQPDDAAVEPPAG